MNSIFDTSEDFDFSDDDLLDGSIFSAASNGCLQVKKGNEPGRQCGYNNSFGHSLDKSAVLDTKEVIINENNLLEESVKDYSVSEKGLRDVSNHAGVGSSVKDNFKHVLNAKPFGESSRNEPKASSEQSPLTQTSEHEKGNKKFKFVKNPMSGKSKNDHVKVNNDHNNSQSLPKEPLDTGKKDYWLITNEKCKDSTQEVDDFFGYVENHIDDRTQEDEIIFENHLLDIKQNHNISSRSIGFNEILPERNLQRFPAEEEAYSMYSKKRMFPGPAGLLPNPTATKDFSSVVPATMSCKKRPRTPKVNHPESFGKSDKDFRQPFWLQLQKETLTKHKGLIYHSISMIQRKANAKQLAKGKVPLMCALIKTFAFNGSDASIILKDPTGEIHGTIHKAVLENYETGLCPGAGFVLKQVSIFSPTPRKHYVNITPSNIVLLLSPDSPLSSSPEYLQVQRSLDLVNDKERREDDMVNDKKAPETRNEDLDSLFAENDDFTSWFDDSEDISEELQL